MTKKQKETQTDEQLEDLTKVLGVPWTVLDDIPENIILLGHRDEKTGRLIADIKYYFPYGSGQLGDPEDNLDSGTIGGEKHTDGTRHP